MEREHEIRDPVHVFVHCDDDELAVIDSAPFQRLRYVHQLALSYLVYPGATHRRFEHSLGAMEVAGRIYDTVTRDEKMSQAVRELVPAKREHAYWRATLRMAALCHDMGHLPFSHAAEEQLLPDGWDHERITWEIVHCPRLAEVFGKMRPKPDPDDVAKLALGPRKVEKLKLGLGGFTAWEAILAEIIVGDVFGADRIDYLLRDSLHAGVAYGRFDHHRLIDTLRILPRAPQEAGEPEGLNAGNGELTLGCERGGLESAEALLLARYFMFAQVYYHPTRLIYDRHLVDFLTAWLPGGRFPTDVEEHLHYSDNEVLAAITKAARAPEAPGHDAARRIVTREHFRVAYQRRPGDPGEFCAENVRYAASPRRGEPPDFPVRDRDGRSLSSLSLSDVLARLPAARDEYVFVDGQLRKRAEQWVEQHGESIRGEVLARTDEPEEAQ
jgi:HD superfamily phosphohydrolase